MRKYSKLIALVISWALTAAVGFLGFDVSAEQLSSASGIILTAFGLTTVAVVGSSANTDS